VLTGPVRTAVLPRQILCRITRVHYLCQWPRVVSCILGAGVGADKNAEEERGKIEG